VCPRFESWRAQRKSLRLAGQDATRRHRRCLVAPSAMAEAARPVVDRNESHHDHPVDCEGLQIADWYDMRMIDALVRQHWRRAANLAGGLGAARYLGWVSRAWRRKVGFGCWRVLVVEDDDSFTEALSELLEADGRLEVAGRARDGREGVELAEALRPDVVLMDIVLPVMDGIEATREIRRRQPTIPVVGITGSEYEERALEVRDAGASRFRRQGSARRRPRRNRRRCGASPSAPWARPSNARLNSDRSPASPPRPDVAWRRRFPPAAEPPSAGGPESRAGWRAGLALRPRSGGCAPVSGRAGGRSPRASSARRRRGRSGARVHAVRAR
jgi:CheY-like chemotaxis protein